jgi:hypothetical protein
VGGGRAGGHTCFSSINIPGMEVRYVRRVHKEFDAAVKAGEQEGFTVCLVNGEILSWVVKFNGPVSYPNLCLLRYHLC